MAGIVECVGDPKSEVGYCAANDEVVSWLPQRWRGQHHVHHEWIPDAAYQCNNVENPIIVNVKNNICLWHSHV